MLWALHNFGCEAIIPTNLVSLSFESMENLQWNLNRDTIISYEKYIWKVRKKIPSVHGFTTVLY